jgi:hypothetical protein
LVFACFLGCERVEENQTNPPTDSYQGDGVIDDDNNQETENETDKEENTDIEQVDFLLNFKNLLNDGKCFILTKNAQTDYSETIEEVYFAGSYIYKFSKSISNIEIVSHKLYLNSGLTYAYNGVNVTLDSAVDFLLTKENILNDLFNDSIAWQPTENGYVYEKGDFIYNIEKGESNNSIKYEIKHSSSGVWVVYKGSLTLYDTLAVDMPVQLSKYI